MNLHDNAEALLRVLREPRRNKYFYGKRMDVQHFQMEQDYGKLKQWLLNRLTLGKGVLCGLRVSVNGGRVCVDPGVAIDGLGREIIVPLRYCIDPVVSEDSCCDGHRRTGTPTPTPTLPPNPTVTPPATRQPGVAPLPSPNVVDGLFTLWLCYRECLTDQQPVLVSECGTRDECAAGTIVESFCLKFEPGMAPPLGDPGWCAKLWAMGQGGEDVPLDVPSDQQGPFMAALASRRHALCELFDQDCDPAEGDPCVPLALVQIKDGQLTVDSCVVRPRIYSNQRLLDLILCLAGKIDECCGDHLPAQPLQVRSIEFIRRTAAGTDTHVSSVQSPLQDTPVDINGKTNAIRIRFNRALATDQHKPTTHPVNDPDFKLHNVQVLPTQPGNALPYVPGSLVLEAPDTVRFDLFKESPYSRGADGWQKGRYQIFLRGTEDLTQNRHALADTTDQPLDGEPIAPAGGVMSGDSNPGGDFTATFTVGAGATPAPSPTPPKLMHVSKIEFLDVSGSQVIGAVKRPDQPARLSKDLGAIRIAFDNPFATAGALQPNVAGLNDANFKAHNVQLRLPPQLVDQVGTPYIAGMLKVEDPRTFRIDIVRGTRLVNQDGRWRTNLRVDCEIFLRGTRDAANNFDELADAAGKSLDGEPKPPSGGVMSGDGNPGGDFTASFSLFISG
jgi:hypothetical protein